MAFTLSESTIFPDIQPSVELKSYTTFGTGGKADFFVCVNNLQQLQYALKWAQDNKQNYFVLGKGSNCIFADEGYRGLVILNQLNDLEAKPPFFMVEAGHSFAHLGFYTAKLGYTGLEFACGIPGSVGGAVYMNAGANASETQNTICWVEHIDENGTLTRYLKKDLEFAYRFSPFQKMKGIVVRVCFELKADPEARDRQKSLLKTRQHSQPLKEKSAGCMFKNPPGNSAGALIEKAGLKGSIIGEVEVSPVHANFLINKGRASSQELMQMLKKVKSKVQQTFQIELETEVLFLDVNGKKQKF